MIVSILNSGLWRGSAPSRQRCSALVGAASSRDKIAAQPKQRSTIKKSSFLGRRRVPIRAFVAVFALSACTLGHGELCAAEAKAARSAAPQARPCDQSLAVSPDEALARLKREPDLLLIDVRGPLDNARLRIPGSLGIPLAFLGTKTFLQGRPVILVGDGFRNAELIEECRRLRQTGVIASILAGGIPAWGLRGYPLEGDRFVLAALRRVSPRTVHQEKDRAAVTLMDFSRELRPDTKTAFASLTHLPAGLSPPGGAGRLKAAVARAGCLEPILVATEAGDGYDLLARQLNDAGINAYFLEGGLAAYRRHLAEIALSWDSREKRLRTVSACRPCGEKQAATDKP